MRVDSTDDDKGLIIIGWLFLAFLVMPLVELWAIIQVGDQIGVLPTVVILLVDSIVGAVIVRREGRRAWAAFRQALTEGRWPGDEVAQGALVLVGGALLLTPGFVTDVLGLSFVLPPTRALWSVLVRRRTTVVAVGGAGEGGLGGALGGLGIGPGRGSGGSDRGPASPPPGDAPGRVIDVEIVDIRRSDDQD